jgi:hypothetical protein
MKYMTIKEQIRSHLNFLLSHELDVNELKINAGFIRCRSVGQSEGRGELCYKTTQSTLNNGMVGLATWCRCQSGVIKTHKTYGISENKEPCGIFVSGEKMHESVDAESLRKSELFWEYSECIGESDYLRKKGVGYYGIRFRSNAYGNVAVIPLRDAYNKLWSYQLLNADGTKRVPKNTKIGGLFHILQPFVNGQAIALAESYVVAATCYEAIGISAVTAVSSTNLERVAVVLRNKYPNSRIIVLADNDRHLAENKGIQTATAIKERLGINCIIAIPDFEGFPRSSNYSDWNDLVREKGYSTVRDILTSIIRS